MKQKAFPIILIVLGSLLLLDTTNLLDIGLDILIPILMIIFGGVKVFNSFNN